MRNWPILAGLLLSVAAAQTPRAELVGFAVLPADTFAEGPPSGQFDGDGLKGAKARFPGQPVQGFSGVQFGEACSTYQVLSDNGFGTKYNSPDYLLRLHGLSPTFETAAGGAGTVAVESSTTLHDPEGHVPFLIVNESTEARQLTGSDFDVESFVVAEDGTLWLGDEFGPYLLHTDATGKLLEPPYPTPNPGAEDPVMSPQNPAMLAAAPQPGAPSSATLGSSKGFEGMATNPARTLLYPLLEGTVAGDPEGTLRIYTFDLEANAYRDEVVYYPLEDPSYAIGDMAVVNEDEFLVIERDGNSGAEATFKKIFKIDMSQTDTQGVVQKEEIVDLLNIANPERLGGFGETFRFPFVTIEDVLVLDEQTLLVMNDNNYDGTGGRGEEVKDPSEIIQVRLAEPLTLAEGIGQPQACR